MAAFQDLNELCLRCRQKDHFARDCPNQASEPRGFGGVRRGRRDVGRSDLDPDGVAHHQGKFGAHGINPENANAVMSLHDNSSTIIKWKIPDLVKGYSSNSPKYSENFKLFSDSNVEVAFFVDCSKFNENEDGFLGLVVQEMGERKSLNLGVRFWLTKPCGKQFCNTKLPRQIVRETGEAIYFKVDPTHGKDVFKNTLVTDDLLFLCCEVENLDLSTPTSSPHQDLGSKLWELYQEGVGYDTIVQAGGKEFKVMSAIFMSQSEVFKTMFSHNFKEDKEKVIQIEDMSADVMEDFICWMYTGQLVDHDEIESLFVVADKYLIDGLKSTCAKMITRTLTEENVARRLALASTHSEKDMEVRIMEYVSTLEPMKIKHIFESKAWLDYLIAQQSPHK